MRLHSLAVSTSAGIAPSYNPPTGQNRSKCPLVCSKPRHIYELLLNVTAITTISVIPPRNDVTICP
jgi:hypothetical protein